MTDTPDPAALARELIGRLKIKTFMFSACSEYACPCHFDGAVVARWALEQHTEAERLRERVRELEAENEKLKLAARDLALRVVG